MAAAQAINVEPFTKRIVVSRSFNRRNERCLSGSGTIYIRLHWLIGMGQTCHLVYPGGLGCNSWSRCVWVRSPASKFDWKLLQFERKGGCQLGHAIKTRILKSKSWNQMTISRINSTTYLYLSDWYTYGICLLRYTIVKPQCGHSNPWLLTKCDYSLVNWYSSKSPWINVGLFYC